MPARFAADEPSVRLGFSGGTLDRRSEARGDADWLALQAGHEEARVLIFAADRVAVGFGEGRAVVAHGLDMARRLGSEPPAWSLLGFDGHAPRFAAETAMAPDVIAALGLKLVDLRSLALQGVLDPADLGTLAQARGLLHWHAMHRFCGRCGAPTRPAAGGYRRECPSCGAEHFPRTDPVVIMLAVTGDVCLLGRQPRFAPGMYSCLAGFVEPGETIEAAVRRETAEEAGITIGRVAYVASQPWPFPASLMIGVFAEALTSELTVDTQELEAARWFDRGEVRAMLAGAHPDGLATPPPIAIAREIVRLWAEA